MPLTEVLVPPFDVTAPGITGIALPCPPRGTIKRLRVMQLAGVYVSYTYTVFNTSAACQVPTGLPLATATYRGSTINVYPAMYYVLPPNIIATSASMYSSDGGEAGIEGLDLPYVCLDGKDGEPLGASSSDRASSLFMKLIVHGTGTKTFGVSMLVETGD